LIDKNWSGFFSAIKDWSRKKGVGYSGKPRLPGYKDKTGRSILLLKPAQCCIKNKTIYFAWEPLRKFSGMKTNIDGRIIQTRFVPKGTCYWLEFVYETHTQELKEKSNRVIGIDLGINNFATIANNIGVTPIIINGKNIKSMNQYFNKKKATIQSETRMSINNRIKNLTDKRIRKLDYFMHCASKFVVEYCKENSIDTIIIGKNNGWKNEVNMGHKNNQSFVNIPYDEFILKLKYKCINVGINVIETEESYTSGTSFLDKEFPTKENYNKSRRKPRGMFTSNNGTKINSDLNGAYQIIRKVLPDAFEHRDRGWALHPVRLTISNKAYLNYRYA
jgi:putative transposase